MSEHQTQEYRGNGKHSYEDVVKEVTGPRVQRLRVPGGWNYLDTKYSVGWFVPMPEVVKHAV